MQWIHSRFKFARRMRANPVSYLIAIVWFLLGVWAMIAFLVPPETAVEIAPYQFIHYWHWYIWIIGALLIICILVFEGGHKAESDTRSELEATIKKLKDAQYDGRPIIVLEVQTYQNGPDAEREWAFKVRNAGLRSPRFVRIESVRSQLDNYILRFGMVLTINNTLGEHVPFSVEPVGNPDNQASLRVFFHDVKKYEPGNPQNPALSIYNIKVKFWDANDVEVSQYVRLTYDFESDMAASAETPFTKREARQQ